MYERNILHRDLNINNVMLHFPDLEPNHEELQDPRLFKYIDLLRNKRIEDLMAVDFEVRIIDYGLSCILPRGELTSTPCGTLEVIAPEVLESDSDHRVDVWGLGLVCYMLFTADCMFKT